VISLGFFENEANSDKKPLIFNGYKSLAKDETF
jgi:hypothetical protein